MKRTIRLLFSTGMVLALFGSGFEASAASTAPVSMAYVVYANPSAQTARLLAFDGKTGSLVRRLPMQYTSATQSPNMLVSSSGAKLYLARLTWPQGAKTGANVISLIDTRSWRTVASVSVAHRMRYTNISPPAMAMSVATNRLFVYSYIYASASKQTYWLSVYNSDTLQAEPTQIALPGCGAERMGSAQGQIVILCIGSQDVRFVDPRSERVTATVQLPKVRPDYTEGLPTALAFSKDRRIAYVVANDLDIVEISTATHRAMRDVRRFRMEPGAVPVIGSADVSADGRFLVVGVTKRSYDPSSGFVLKFFSLPTMNLAKSLPMPYTHFITDPSGGFFVFRMADSPGSSTTRSVTKIKKLTIAHDSVDSISLRALLQVKGLVYDVSAASG